MTSHLQCAALWERGGQGGVGDRGVSGYSMTSHLRRAALRGGVGVTDEICDPPLFAERSQHSRPALSSRGQCWLQSRVVEFEAKSDRERHQ